MSRPAILAAGRRTRVLGLILAAIGAAACSGDDGAPDAGSMQATLEILDPPGDSIGLPYGGSSELRVRYLGPDGLPVGGIGVDFELVAGPTETVGGATLSAALAGTAETGIAGVVVTGGAGEANFRVRVQAPGASDASFFVVVSSSGFFSFRVSANHRGARPESDYGNLEYRLYDPSEVVCTTLDIDALPASVLPPRSAPSFAESVAYKNLGANRAYTLISWGENAPGLTPLGVGCVELAADQGVPGASVAITMPVVDRALRWPVAIEIESSIVFPQLSATIDSAVGPNPWRTIECNLGAAQLLLDCLADADASDGALDCVATISSPIGDDIEALRGTLDFMSCRPSERSPGVPSLDRALLDRMTTGPWTEANAPPLARAQAQMLSGLALESSLIESGGLATHTLGSLRLGFGGISFDDDLAGSSRAIVSASGAAAVDSVGVLAVASHRFTIDLERSLAAAFDQALLPARGLTGRGSDLGTALGASFGGCAAISSEICGRISRPATCLAAACTASTAALNSRLRAWITAAAAAGLDAELEGSAIIVDRDFDLAVDRVGGGSAAADGEWQVVLETGGGSVAGVGAFGGP